MIYYVRTGGVDTSVTASSHRHAAMKAVQEAKKELGMCVIVNEKEFGDDAECGSVFFLTQCILDECSMRVVS